MLNRFRPGLNMALAGVALGALVPLAACNQAIPEQAAYSPRLPNLPATLPLSLDEPRPIAYAPAASALPRVRKIQAARVADPDDYYAWADDAWSYYDTLGEAPPDYGFYYDDVEPWAWQGYDDSLMFVEPLDYGYRSYYYRPGEEYPYFVRDPEYGYGYDDGLLAVVYDALGAIIPYDDYYDGPYLDYASSYYDRGYHLYSASRVRHPVIAATWYDVQPTYSSAFLDWEEDLWRQPSFWDYHERTFDVRDRYWQEERVRREAETVRYAAWQDLGFQALPPPRAIPRNWQRADWARDERWYAPAVSGFDGDSDDQQRAVRRERQRIASLSGDTVGRDQLRLAALREQVRRDPDRAPQRTERMAEVRRQFQDRQVQLASRTDRSALRERSLLERQERALARVQQKEVRRDRAIEPQRLAGVERRQLREAAREQRLNRTERPRQEVEMRGEVRQRQQALAEGRQQRLQQRAESQDRRLAQVEARAQAQRRQEAQVQARAEARQRRDSQEQGRAEAQQRRQAQVQARAEAQQRRQAQEQARAERQQRQSQAAASRQRESQARAEAGARAAERQQARQAAEQQRAAREQARQQRVQAASQARAQAGARAAERQQARQAAEQQRAGREQARQQRAQAESQARAQAGARAAEREQARQAAEQQRAGREQARQAAEQQRAQRQQQAQAEAQSRAARVAQTDAAQTGNGNPAKERRGRGQN